MAAPPAPPPVIAIDGPSASGKGTVARQVAKRLAFHCLDSGALYRAVALASLEAGVDLDDNTAVRCIALNLKVELKYYGQVWIAARDVSDAIRDERVSAGAPTVSSLNGTQIGLPCAERRRLEREQARRRQ